MLLAEPGVEAKVGCFTSETWAIIDELVDILEPCYQATVELSGEKFSTASKIIPMTRELMRYYCNKMEPGNGQRMKTELASKILHNLVRRWETIEDDMFLCKATILDPTSKTLLSANPQRKMLP